MTTSIAGNLNADTINSVTGNQYNTINYTRSDIRANCLPHAVRARFENADRNCCLDGTRTDLLEQIDSWIRNGERPPKRHRKTYDKRPGDALTSNDSWQTQRIFWINGSAGTGKTTIAATVANECRKRRILGASFFCSRDDAECSNASLMFTTIAYQLGLFFPPLQTELTNVLKSNPDIIYSSVPFQLEELIVNPLRRLGTSFPRCVVVMDAIDECKDNGATSIILSSLSRFVNDLQNLKFLITSRPEPRITSVFKSSELQPATRPLVLHEVALDVVGRDIERYLDSSLKRIRTQYNVDVTWPSQKDIRDLAKLSFGLFIFAATATRFIEDRNYSNPKHQLAALLSNAATSPQYRLDHLYTQVLHHAFPDISPQLENQLRLIVGSIVLLRDPLPPHSLEQLLNLESNVVQTTLAHLHSVIIVPVDDEGVIRLLHPSFYDYITDPTRCANHFFVDARMQNTILAEACFNTLCGLRQDICGIQDPSLFNSEIDDLANRISQNIPPHLRYACQHWAFHLENGIISDIILELLKAFCSTHLLQWIEVCSLLGELRGAILSLSAAREALARANSLHVVPDVVDLLQDCERFSLEFFPCLSVSSLQAYGSALLFTPTQTSLRRMYAHQVLLPVNLCNAPQEQWSPCVRVIEGHRDPVCCVAYAPDGTRVVSGSEDKTLRLWDAVTGAHLLTFGGHSGWVRSVAFSSDSTRIVSGCSDGTICLWDATNGDRLYTLEGPSYAVPSVAFSSDGMRIVSGSCRQVLVWDAVTGIHLRTFKFIGHDGYIGRIALSPDDSRIVFASSRVLKLWDASTEMHLHTLIGHERRVTSVAFSPDSTCVVSGSLDLTVRLWDAETGAPLRTLTGCQPIWSVAFSPDGTHIVSGSLSAVELWDTTTGNVRMSEGYSSSTITFSPDGTRIVSGSDDATLRILDASSGSVLQPTKDIYVYPIIALSPDDTRLLTASVDHDLQLWNATTGIRQLVFNGHTSTVTAATFSPDSTRIASCSEDTTVRLWTVETGAPLCTLQGHSASVSSLAFSPDGTRIASASYDQTVRLWDAESGAHLSTLKGHSDDVISVAFSPNGTDVVSASFDQTLRLWNAMNGTHLRTFKFEYDLNDPWSVAFSPDGTRIVSGHTEAEGIGRFALWDAKTGSLLDTIDGNPESVPTFACSVNRTTTSFSRRDCDDPSTVCLLIIEDGWVIDIRNGRRFCWIPVSYRRDYLAVSAMRVALPMHDGTPVILDFSAMIHA